MRLFAVVAVMIIVLTSASTLAENTVEREQLCYLNAADESVYTSFYNGSAANNTDYTNYNQTIYPFMNESGIEGTYTGTFMPIMVGNLTDDPVDKLELWGLVRLKADWIMSGSSLSWWRIPVLGVYDWTSLSLWIWQVNDLGAFTISTAGVIEPGVRPIKVFGQSYRTQDYNVTYYQHNITAWGIPYNSTYVRVDAPIHSDEWYCYRWVIDEGLSLGPQTCFSQTDVGDDGLLNTWYSLDDAAVTNVSIDLDASIIHQYGMGYAVSGFEVEVEAASDVTMVFITKLKTPVDSVDDNITFLMPFVTPLSNATNAYIHIVDEDDTWFLNFWACEDGPTDFAIKSKQWGHAWEEDTFIIEVTLYNLSNQVFIYNPNTEYDPYFNTTYCNYFYLRDSAVFPSTHLFYFIPYHSLQLTVGQWENTWAPPVYVWFGRVVSLSDMRLKRESHSDPWWIQCWRGWVAMRVTTLVAVYNLADLIFWDALPDLTVAQVYKFFNRAADAFHKYILHPIAAVGCFFVNVYNYIAKYGPLIFAISAKVLGLIVIVPIFIAIIMVINSVKRWGVIMAADGPEIGMEYAAHLVKNAFRKFEWVSSDNEFISRAKDAAARRAHMTRMNVRNRLRYGKGSASNYTEAE